MSREFLVAYFRGACQSIGNDLRDNYDERRFGPEPRPSRRPAHRVRDALVRWAGDAGFTRTGAARRQLEAALDFVTPQTEELAWLYDRLVDVQSRSTLVEVLLFRALGYRRIRLSTNTAERAELLRRIDEASARSEAVELPLLGSRGRRTDLREFGYPIEVITTPNGVLHQFLRQQYRCDCGDFVIGPSAGDVVLDAGGCFGDTALSFAHQVGAAGRVFSFEFIPENLDLFRRNLALNPDLARRITIVEAPVWSADGAMLYIEGAGPATRVLSASRLPDAKRVSTVTIDTFVRNAGLERVDLVKMDIEGAEVAALAGSEETIREHVPKLAICVYHRLSDFWTVPQFLDRLGLGYRFWLRHNSIHREETVLFAVRPEFSRP